MMRMPSNGVVKLNDDSSNSEDNISTKPKSADDDKIVRTVNKLKNLLIQDFLQCPKRQRSEKVNKTTSKPQAENREEFNHQEELDPIEPDNADNGEASPRQQP